jgi:hypothetical protein
VEQRDLFPYVELRRAKLCLDCEVIFEGLQCPACTSETYVPVTRWIRPTERVEAPKPAPPPPPPSKPRRLLRKSLYVGLGAYGVWKMLFEPSKPRRRKPTPPVDPPESPG